MKDLGTIIGQHGTTLVDGTDPVAGAWDGFLVLAEAEIGAITAPGIDNAAGLVGMTLGAGQQVLGRITSIELASGVIQLVKARSLQT